MCQLRVSCFWWCCGVSGDVAGGGGSITHTHAHSRPASLHPQLPRPSHTDRTSFLATLFDSTHLRRAALAWHGASIVRWAWVRRRQDAYRVLCLPCVCVSPVLTHTTQHTCREVWYHWTEKGTFRRLAKAVWGLLTGKGWHFDFPTAHEAGVPAGTPCTRDEPGDQGDW